MKAIIYKGYRIESYAETQLIAGPYENNEERQYRETGKTLYKAVPLKESLPQIRCDWTCDSIKAVKDRIKNKLNKKRTTKLEASHRRELKKFLSLRDKLRSIENELSLVGGEYQTPSWSTSYV